MKILFGNKKLFYPYSATLFIFLTFLHLIKLISWPLHRIILIGAIPQVMNIMIQFGFHNFMRYTSCQLWQNETVIEAPYSLDNMTQVSVRIFCYLTPLELFQYFVALNLNEIGA